MNLSNFRLANVERCYVFGHWLRPKSAPNRRGLGVKDEAVWVIEVNPRSIGGFCSRVLRFGVGMSLEELIIRQALGQNTGAIERQGRPAGVMMIPVPRAGILEEVRGVAAVVVRGDGDQVYAVQSVWVGRFPDESEHVARAALLVSHFEARLRVLGARKQIN